MFWNPIQKVSPGFDCILVPHHLFLGQVAQLSVWLTARCLHVSQALRKSSITGAGWCINQACQHM